MSRHGKFAPGRARITFVLPEKVRDALRVRAEADNRTLSNYIATQVERMVIEETQAEYGQTPETATKPKVRVSPAAKSAR